jgi:hypothetical protein
MTARPHFLRGYTDEWANTQPAVTPLPEPAQEDTGMLIHLHRVTQVPVGDAANDMDAEDEILSSSMTSLELLAISFGLVFAIAASIYQPWQWF